MTTAGILLLGFLLGMKHATEADHLAAVATLATRKGSWKDGLRQGSAWGVGHTLTLLLVGGSVLVLGQTIPPGIEDLLEMCVGLMLVLLGVDVLRRLRRENIHFHAHAHDDGQRHIHAHSHAQSGLGSAPSDLRKNKAIPTFRTARFVPMHGPEHAGLIHDHPHPQRASLRAILVGMMHGIAGSAALIVLSLDAMPSSAAGLAYILIFGMGSILGMALLSTIVAWPLRATANSLNNLHRGMKLAVGAFSVVLGVWVIVRIAVLGNQLLG